MVAHDYAMGEWNPDDEKTLIVPEKVVGDPGKSYIFMWIVPARVAGSWESQIMAGSRSVRYEFSLEQHLPAGARHRARGRAGRESAPVPDGRASRSRSSSRSRGRAGRSPTSSAAWSRAELIEGNVTIGEGAGQRVVPWQARLTRRGAGVPGRRSGPHRSRAALQ